MILNFIENLYYRLYKFSIWLGEKSIPRYNAVLLLSILTIFNLATIISFLIGITNKILIVNLPKGYLFLIGLSIIAINSYFIFNKKRFLIIEENYKKEDVTIKKRKILQVIMYVILTILLLVCSLFYLNIHPIKP